MRNVLFAGIAVIVGLSTGGVAFATPPSTGVRGDTLARGLADEKVRTRGNLPYDVIVQEIVIPPGGHTGWHTHPGIAVAVVKAGKLTVFDSDDASCSPQDYGTHQVYVDPGYGHAHIAFGDPLEETRVVVTYLDVPLGGAPRIDSPDPGNCSF